MPTDMLRIAVPNKGSLADTAAEMLAEAGYTGRRDPKDLHVIDPVNEVWMAAEYQSNAETAEEISQLLYHLQVLMLAKGLSLEDVYRHL